MRALAVTGAHRSPALPDVPTLAEAGARDQESDIILGILVPAGTAQGIIERLNREIGWTAALPDVRERLAARGVRADRQHTEGIRRPITGRSTNGRGHSCRQYQGAVRTALSA